MLEAKVNTISKVKASMYRKKNRDVGFTLVELMIVVVILGILASIAVPRFGLMVTRAKVTELKTGLWHLVNLEKSFYNAYDRYEEFAYGVNSPILGYNQPTKSHFTYAFVAADTAAYGKENGVSSDINGDGDGGDGLFVSVTGREGVINGSAGDDFAW